MMLFAGISLAAGAMAIYVIAINERERRQREDAVAWRRLLGLPDYPPGD